MKTAQQAYADRRWRIVHLIARLPAFLAKNDARQRSDPRNWGHEGDLSNVEENLLSALRWLGAREVKEEPLRWVSARSQVSAATHVVLELTRREAEAIERALDMQIDHDTTDAGARAAYRREAPRTRRALAQVRAALSSSAKR